MDIRKNSGSVKWTLIVLCWAFLVVFLILPLIYIVVTALRSGIQTYWNSITDEYALKAAFLTIEAMVWAVVINTIFGVCAAWTLTKFQFRGKKTISTLIDLPVTVSPIIAGLIYVLTFGRQSFLFPILDRLGLQII
ncbi:MAG: sulfate ABC transporter permease subunit CysW, partial [Thermoguttaceae bacterium]|nr:sulfate ABC transporter permease subunit CysW [Thermoguttaceae bacterium]